MSYHNKDLSGLLQRLDLGSSVAESDTLLETARIETSAFTDLLNDPHFYIDNCTILLYSN